MGPQPRRDRGVEQPIGGYVDDAVGDNSGEGGPAVMVDVDTLLPILRRVVGARVSNHADAEDLVQEALARVLQHRDRIDEGMLEPYAISTARNLVATMWRSNARQ